jgi:hypothetical protein
MTIILSCLILFCFNLQAAPQKVIPITPRLAELLLDPDLLTPEKVFEIDSIIKTQSKEIQQIYEKASQNGFNDNVGLIQDAAKELTRDIFDSLANLSKNHTIDLKKETDFYIVGGSLENMYQYNKYLSPSKKANYNWKFMPISRNGFNKLDPEGFKKYVQNLFEKSISIDKNIIIIDTFESGVTLEFIRGILSELIEKKKNNLSEKKANVIVLGLVEYLRDSDDPKIMYKNFASKMNSFYASQDEHLPILKIASNSYSIKKLSVVPKSHPGKYDRIGEDGRPRTDTFNQDPLKELEDFSNSKKPVKKKVISRKLEVYLGRRFEAIRFMKKYYSQSRKLFKTCNDLYKQIDL